MKQVIQNIQQQIKEELFTNKASVIRGIINPILQELGWPITDIRIVRPEFTLENQRVDIALFHNNQAIIFVEAKMIVRADGAEKQLFEYALRAGVPILILTDGPTWHFFLTTVLCSYEQSKVSRLDLMEYEDIDQLCSKLNDYLSYNNVITGQAQKNLEDDYNKKILQTAWEILIGEKDDLLFELIANKVEELYNYKPSQIEVFNFLTEQNDNPPPITNDTPPSPDTRQRTEPSGSLGFTRIINCNIGGINPGDHWTNLMSTGICIAIESGLTIDDIKESTTINLLEGEKRDKGYNYVRGAGVSYQGMSANITWENALKLAQLTKQNIYVEFEWRDNPRAAHPGKREILSWGT